MAATKRPPRDLGTAGAELWREVMAEYDLTFDYRSILHEACLTLDRIRQCDEIVNREGHTVMGYRGARQAHPLLSEARQARGLLQRLLKSLELNDDEPTKQPKDYRGRFASKKAK